MNDFLTEERSSKYPTELLEAWAIKTGCNINDERIQFPDECGWPLDFMYFEAGWNARFSVVNTRQAIAEMPTVDFASDGEELIRRDDVFALLRAGVEKAVSIPSEPDQTKYERDTLIWMLIDITGEPKADLFAEAIAEIKKLKEIREGATHWAGNAVHFQQEVNELKTILSQIVSSDPCRLDHHGYCQEHLWVGRGECAHGRARKLLGYDTQ